MLSSSRNDVECLTYFMESLYSAEKTEENVYSVIIIPRRFTSRLLLRYVVCESEIIFFLCEQTQERTATPKVSLVFTIGFHAGLGRYKALSSDVTEDVCTYL
jgi:hypothetical protein